MRRTFQLEVKMSNKILDGCLTEIGKKFVQYSILLLVAIILLGVLGSSIDWCATLADRGIFLNSCKQHVNEQANDQREVMVVPQVVTATPNPTSTPKSNSDDNLNSTGLAPAYPYCQVYEETGVGLTKIISLNLPSDWVAVIDAVSVEGYISSLAVLSISGPVPSDLVIQDGAVCAVKPEWREWAENDRLYWARTHNPDIQLIRR